MVLGYPSNSAQLQGSEPQPYSYFSGHTHCTRKTPVSSGKGTVGVLECAVSTELATLVLPRWVHALGLQERHAQGEHRKGPSPS